jgi:hypothetical protein
MISNCIDRVAGNLNDRDLPERDESGAFPGKLSVASGIRENRGKQGCLECLQERPQNDKE